VIIIYLSENFRKSERLHILDTTRLEGTLPEDGNVMPKHVGPNIHNI
jgi:hypothetical protein